MPCFLGLDIGTSALKALLVDETEAVLAEESVDYPVLTPRPDWREQDPEAWWTAVLEVCGTLKATAPAAWQAVSAIGLSGQMHGTVLLDRHHQVIRPAILWNDGRARLQCAELTEAVPTIGEISGVPPAPGLGVPKLLWLRDNEPETLRRLHLLLAPKDYVRLRLTSEAATDPCDASGLQLLDVGSRAWSTPLVEACGCSMDQLPVILEGSAIGGGLTAEVAEILGLPRGLPVATGAGDAAAGAVGIGAVDEGDGFISLGTSAQYFVTTNAYRPRPLDYVHAYAHGLPARWFQMAALLNGASVAGWAGQLLGSATDRDLRALSAEASDGYQGPGGLLVLPYLTGERTPLNDPNARGVVFGATPETGRVDVFRACLEGVALSLMDAQSVLSSAGTRVDRLMAVGGGTRNPFWIQMIASALNRPIDLVEGSRQGPAFGATRLARLAAEGRSDIVRLNRPSVSVQFEPDPEVHARFIDAHGRFKDLYAALRPVFQRF